MTAVSSYAVYHTPPGSDQGFIAYGGNSDFWYCTHHESLLSGPYETGKTFTALNKLHYLLCKYPKSRGLMARKTYTSLMQSAVVTYEQKVLTVRPDHPKSPVRKIGGVHPQSYIYPNGAELVVAGLDNPGKVLSSEYDFVYVNQLEELSLDDYETLTGRATGRAGNAQRPYVMGDCNPGSDKHWILDRAKGGRLKLFESRHEDNPTLYDHKTGQWTVRGKLTISILDGLTGLRYKRGRLGLWVGAEGQVYEGYDPAIHAIDRFAIPGDWRRYRSVDFGHTNPFSCSWWAVDHDGRLYHYRQLYMTKRTVKVHAAKINQLSEGERIIATIADHDAEDRATLAENGIPTQAADKRITVGIEKVAERLKLQGDGKPRIFFLRDSLIEVDEDLKARFKPLCTEDEFPAYVWPKGADGRSNKEIPLDDNNHGLDETRYMVMHFDGKEAGKTSGMIKYA